ncbi:MAG TPA: ABC transporter permease [Vicinamibacterales bacterium]|nr:ABC transporter permease [Vicinamibacterales bacterium]
MLNDFRYALRGLRRSPGFTGTAVLTLALGIGGTSAVFTVVNRLLLDPLPFEGSDRLVLIWGSKPHEGQPEIPFSQPDFEDLRTEARSFAAIGAWASGRGALTATEEHGRTPTDTRRQPRSQETGAGSLESPEPERVQFAVVTSNFFDLFGTRPVVGRTFRPEEERRGSDPVVLISDGLWRRRFAQSPGVIGGTLRLDGRVFAIVGVLPADFRFLTFPENTDVWLPLGSDPSAGRAFARGMRSLGVIGRLADGVTLPQARSEADGIASRLAAAYPRFNTGRRFAVVPLREQVARGVRVAALVFLAGVAIVLLVACANVAGLLLARGSSRLRELAIRATLGASRWRLARQQFAESVVLAASGGLAGLLLATWLVDLIVQLPFRTDSVYVPYSVPRTAIAVDGVVLLFTVLISGGTALLFGLAPAMAGSRWADRDALRTSGRVTAGRRHRRLRAVLVTGEVALALVLLVTASLTVRSFSRLQQVDPGFSTENVLTMQVTLSPASYAAPAAIERYYREALDRLQRLPGVEAAGAVEFLPLAGLDSSTGFYIEGRPAPARADEQQAHPRSASAEYFRALGIQVVRGRAFSAADTASSPRVAVINETMARRFWPGEDAIGRRIALDFETMRFFPDRPPVFDIPAGMREIVGIVRDVRHASLQAAPVPELYTPAAQRPVRDMTLVVRGSGEPSSLAGAMRERLRTIDQQQPLGRIVPASGLVADSTARQRSTFVVLTVFAAVALTLATVGIYGLLAYSVVQRRSELGVRLALGGQPRHVRTLILREGLALAALGVAIGIPASIAVAYGIRALLVGVAPTDPMSLGGSVALILAVAAAAGYVPAKTATGIDPLAALRAE